MKYFQPLRGKFDFSEKKDTQQEIMIIPSIINFQAQYFYNILLKGRK